MVEMHLLSVNVDFSYNSIYALGVFTAFERFMQGYQPERDKEPIFNALCQAVEDEPQRYRQDAEQLIAVAKGLPVQELIGWLSGTTNLYGSGDLLHGTDDLSSQFQAITNNPNFKYSRLFATGLFTLLELADPELVKDEKQRTEVLKQISTALHLSEDKLQKDVDLYRSNLEKMSQALIVMADMLLAERKKRQQRSLAQEAVVVPSSADEPSEAPGTPQDKASSGS